jgi:L-threonylcarbamoyladenylate synthase
MQAEIGQNIERCAQLLSSGEVVAIPTETVYGLAGNALNQEAISKIFEVKNRPSFDPLIVHLLDRTQIEDICTEIPNTFQKLYDAFCPGPITFILPKTECISDLVTAGHPTVGVRFPKHELSRSLMKKCGFPLAAPSANPFGYVSPTSAQHVANQLGKKTHYILDGGPCTVGLESTIIDLCATEPKVLRLGGLSVEEIEDVLGHSVALNKTSSSNPNAPGMLSSHYSPGKKVQLIDSKKRPIVDNPTRTGAITFKSTLSFLPKANQWVLSPKGDLQEAAQNLFKALRETDDTQLSLILAEEFPNQGLGKAINDRLKRASAAR